MSQNPNIDHYGNSLMSAHTVAVSHCFVSGERGRNRIIACRERSTGVGLRSSHIGKGRQVCEQIDIATGAWDAGTIDSPGSDRDVR